MYEYVREFEKLGFGMFVHFGIYSVLGKGEWALNRCKVPEEKYEKLATKFKVKKNWAKDLVATAKKAGCKYITLTTRHHDGFSLYDTCGLNTYDAPHSAAGRDLIREFVDECNKQGIVPFFYHTLIDWHNKDCYANFPRYIDYLVNSVELLCTNYGKIGGFWFDGYWDNPSADWQFDRLYSMIRKHQPEAMIINNTGMTHTGVIGHPEIDSVTYEKKTPRMLGTTERPVAGEMCQTGNDHWGYAKCDVAYKSVGTLISELITCRSFNCNFLMNVGPMGNGDLRLIDKATLLEMGKWIKYNKDFIYDVKRADIEAENAILLKNGKGEYFAVTAVAKHFNVQHNALGSIVEVKIDAKIKSARWLENGKRIKLLKNKSSYMTEPYGYGTSMCYRVAKLELEEN